MTSRNMLPQITRVERFKSIRGRFWVYFDRPTQWTLSTGCWHFRAKDELDAYTQAKRWLEERGEREMKKEQTDG